MKEMNNMKSTKDVKNVKDAKDIKNVSSIKKTIKLSRVLFICISSVLFFAAGCGSMNSSFDCPNKPGVMCRSLDQVNSMVDHGEIGRDVGVRKENIGNFHPVYTLSNGETTKAPLRTGERIARIWIAPYQDLQGNYHDEGMLYTVVSSSHWEVPKEVKE